MEHTGMTFHGMICALIAGSFAASVVAAPDSAEADKSPSADCAKFSKQADADVGDIIRAGCKPTLAQMSALMDNPVGNVAMWWNQVDYYGLENPKFNKSDHKTNYMGIIQWPQALNSNWNLINRVVYNVTRSPIDENKVDDFGSAQGALLPPSNFGRQSPIDVFGGSTTGLGDSYYVGLFSPKKPVKLATGNFVWGLGFDAGFPTASWVLKLPLIWSNRSAPWVCRQRGRSREPNRSSTTLSSAVLSFQWSRAVRKSASLLVLVPARPS